jgi:hypothetical protein
MAGHSDEYLYPQLCREWEAHSQDHLGHKVRPFHKNEQQNKAYVMTQGAEKIPIASARPMSSVPSIAKKKKKVLFKNYS